MYIQLVTLSGYIICIALERVEIRYL